MASSIQQSRKMQETATTSEYQGAYKTIGPNVIITTSHSQTNNGDDDSIGSLYYIMSRMMG